MGCADERAPINRVQPQAMDKSFFVGSDLVSSADDPEFYMRNTVVDVPYGAGQQGLFTASYAQPVNRIKWEIQEENLIARLTFEHISNSDANGTKTANSGQVVAMFKISSHFDVRRSYNPTTGEELNIVEENAADRPWYQRQFFRVDWSKNLVTDGYAVDTASMLGIQGGVTWSPLSYYEQDPKSPNAPVFAPNEGYFDVTTKAFASPEIIDFKEYNVQLPACFFNTPVTNCNSTEVTLRLSFKKVVDTDFESTEWDGNKMNAFGAFTEDRYGYDRNYGVVDERTHRMQAKHNVWTKSHVDGAQCGVDTWRDAAGNVAKYKVDASGAFVTDPTTGQPIPDANGQPYARTSPGAVSIADADNNGTDDECEFRDAGGLLVHEGSRCDTFARKCTLPAYERQTKTIPYYYGAESPADLFDVTANALGQWDVAMRHAVQVRKSVEAARAGFDNSVFTTDEAAIAADVDGQIEPHVFVLCHNPVIGGDDKACGPVGTRTRIGDLRYNVINLLPAPQSGSPWGIMVDAVDPLTGEKISSSVNEWTSVLDVAAQQTADLVRWFNGEISDDDVTTGRYIRSFVEASKLGTREFRPPTLSDAEIKARIGSVNLSALPAKPVQAGWERVAGNATALRSASQSLAQKFGPSLDSQFEASRQAVMDSPIETMLVTPDMLQAAGFDPSTPVAGNAVAIQRSSPLRGMNNGLRQWINHMRDLSMAKSGSCAVEQPEPNSLLGLAHAVQRQFPMPDKNAGDYAALLVTRNQQIHQWIREQMHLAVIAHELGHSMGLRHNFTGTWDALNFRTSYWQLRTQNGAEKSCRKSDGDNFGLKSHANGADCVGPRWVDPVTDQEVDGQIWRYGTSTVMDYPGDSTQDFNGLGPYDKAAIRFMYGETVDVETDKSATKKADYLGYLDSNPTFYFSGKHYSEFNDAYNLLGSCAPSSDPNATLGTTCTGPSLDYVSTRDMKDEGGKFFSVDPAGRVRHPYMFSSDEYALPTNVSNNRFDSGADAYEKMQFLITSYEDRYIFDNFRRDRVQFSSGGVRGRLGDRYFDMMAGVTKDLGLLVQVYGELFGKDTVTQLTSRVDYLLPAVLASADGFSTFARMLTRPAPGDYLVQQTPDGKPYARTKDDFETDATAFTVPVGAGGGRFINNDYDFANKGYYWSDYQTRVGSTYEKQMAMEIMLEAYNRFVQVDRRDFVDGRWKNINYATLYPEQVRRLFSSIMQSDPQTLGPYVVPAAAGAASAPLAVQYPAWDKSDDLARPAGAVTLEPLVGWEQQLPSLVSAFMYAPTTLTMDWYDQMRIFVRGGPDDVQVNGTMATFEDPESRIVYQARDYGPETINGKQVSRNSGARMLAYASSLIPAAYAVDATGAVQYDAAGRPTIKDESKATILRRFVANIAVVRQVSRAMSGPLGHGQ